MDKQDSKIKVKKRGNKLGFWFFKTTIKIFGLRAAYGLLYFVCLHYCLFDRQASKAALCYLDRMFGRGNFWQRKFRVYKLFVSQGKQLIDRYVSIAGAKKFDIQLKGYDKLKSLLENPQQGLIILTAHVGNWQIAMTTLSEFQRKVYLVMRPEDNQAVASSLNISKEKDFIRVINPEGFLGNVVEIIKALGEGDFVSIMGDRKYGFKGIDVKFFGDTAYFPFGAFSIAQAAKVPIVLLLSAKVGTCKYEIDVTNIFYPKEEPGNKKEQVKLAVQEFATILEQYIKKYPYQCFLFHDVWSNV